MKTIFTLLFSILFVLNLSAQTCCDNDTCYVRLDDISGFDTDPYLDSLKAAACQLVQAFPAEFQNQFKVYDFGFYLHNEDFQGGFPDVFQQAINEIHSQYYLIFGKQTDQNGIYTKFRVDLKLPDHNIFYCLDLLSPNLRNNLTARCKAVANETFKNSNMIPELYYMAEIEVMKDLAQYISDLGDCCDYSNRDATGCTSCVLSMSYYESKLDDVELLDFEVDKVIDETTYNMGVEEIGFKIVSYGMTIDLDSAMTTLKQEIQADFPGTSIKVYPCNYEQGCSDFDDIHNSFLNDNVEIGIIIGVVGVDGQKGSVRWRMISDEDPSIEPTTFNSDTCYYFNQDKLYTHKEHCTDGIRPRGILENFEGNNFDYEFRFADPEITPRTLTTGMVKDSFGVWLEYLNTEEPLLNMAYTMSKDDIMIRLVEAIPDQDNWGEFEEGAFGVHFFAPWSLLMGSAGMDAPFDYSTKDFFLDRTNYLFITDDGANVVGHNFRNMGNFLWGAATYIMGVPQWMALSGAHLNNMFSEFGSGGFDNPDDQYSIKLGRYYAKQKGWRIYGGRNNIFRK